MERKIFELVIEKESSQDDIRGAFADVNLNKLLKLVRQDAIQRSEVSVQVIRTIFQYYDHLKDQSPNPHFHTYQFCLSILQQLEIPTNAVTELVDLLILQTEKLSSSNLVQVSTEFLESIKKGDMFDKWIGLFPKILYTLSAQTTVACGDNNFSGSEFKSHLINSLLTSRWQSSSVIHLVTVLKNVVLTSEDLKRAVAKVFKLLPELDIDELPPLLFQLLQLCSKGQQLQVLKGIISYFNKKNQKLEEQNDANSLSDMDTEEAVENFDTVKITEGTVILHIYFAAKQDNDLGKEFIKIIKANKFNSEFVLSPFCLGLALAIAKIKGFKDQVFDLIKCTILRSYQEEEKKLESLWIRELFVSDSNVSKRVIRTIHYSKFGWDHITDTLVILGLNVVESFGSKGGRSKEDFTLEKACQLGKDILVEAFKVHPFIRPNILEQVLDRIICRDIDSVSKYTGVLCGMVEHNPQVFLGCLNKVEESLYCLPYLSQVSAMGLLQALMPLLKVSLTLRDALMFTLRKTLYNRDLEARKVAISGHLLILKNFRVLGGSSNYSQSQNSQCASIPLSQVLVDVNVAKHNKAANEALCLELLSTLQKTLTQQAPARQLLYQEIHHVLRKNPSVSGGVLELLLNQFQKYYEWSDEISPPLKLEACVQIKMDEPVLSEPFSHLLHAVQLCLSIAEKRATEDEFFNEDLEGPNSAFNKLKSALQTLVRRMVATDIEDFDLDKTSDYSHSSLGLKNQLYAEQLLGCYEALMEFSYRSGQQKAENCKDLLALFNKYHSLAEVREKFSSGKKGDEGKKGDGAEQKKGKDTKKGANDAKKGASDKRKKGKAVHSILSLEVLSKLLCTLFCGSSNIELECVGILKESEEFINYLIATACQTVQFFKDKGKTYQHEAEKSANRLALIGRALVKHYLGSREQSVNRNTQTQLGGRGNKVPKGQHTALTLECLLNLVTLHCKQYPQHLHTFIMTLKSGQETSSVSLSKVPFQDVLRGLIKKFQKMVQSVLADPNDQHLRDAIPILGIIRILSEQLHHGFDQDLYKWITQLCRQQNITDGHVSRALLSLALELSHKSKTCMPFFCEVTQGVHRVLGDIEEDACVDEENNFGVVSQSTAVLVEVLAVQQLDNVINQCSWVLAQIKADSATNSEHSAPDQNSSSRPQQKEVCVRLGLWVVACQPVLQTAMPLGTLTLATLKTLTHFFNFLTAFAKYETSLYTDGTGHVSSHYEKLVKLCATNLTPKVYSFITYIEAVEREKYGQKKPKQKSEAGKAQREVPDLICSIEQYERCLLTLSKRSKVNLTDHLKRSTARDFRINTEAIQNALKANDDSEEEADVDEAEAVAPSNPEENVTRAPEGTLGTQPPTAKRGRRNLGPKRGSRGNR